MISGRSLAGLLLQRQLPTLRALASQSLVEVVDPYEPPTVKDFRPRFQITPQHQFKAATYNILAPCYASHQ